MNAKFQNVKEKYSHHFNNIEKHLGDMSEVLKEEKNGKLKSVAQSSGIIIKVVTELSRLLPQLSIDTSKGKDTLTEAQKKYICEGILSFIDGIFERMNQTIPLLRDSDIDERIYAEIRPCIKEFIMCNLDRFSLGTCCCI